MNTCRRGQRKTAGGEIDIDLEALKLAAQWLRERRLDVERRIRELEKKPMAPVQLLDEEAKTA